MKLTPLLRLAPLLVVTAPLAHAHPGHRPADFATGFVHPFTGWDHLLAMIAVGFWATQLGGRCRWALPATFVGAMALGAAAGVAGWAPAGVEWGIVASVVGLGLAVAGAVQVRWPAGIVLVALAGLAHGLAHGAEMPAQASTFEFLAGMIAATAALHGAGLGAGRLLQARQPAALRLAGAGILAGGLLLLVG